MTRLARLSLANRALVALAAVLVAVFGAVSAVQLRQELIPDLEIPILAVVTASPGSSPDVVDARISEPLARAVTDVDGLSSTSSTSSSGLSVVQLELDYGTDLDAAQQQVQSSLSRISTQLPAGAQPQVIAGSIDDLPVVQLSVTSDLDPQQLSQALQTQAVPELSGLEGVREVTVSGASAQQVLLAVDPARLAAAGLTAASITTALQSNGIVVPAGTIADGDRTLSVSVGTPVTSVEDLRALPLGPGTTLGEVADVREGTAPATSIARTDGRPSLALAITKTPDGNTVDVSHAIADALPGLAETIGSGTSFGTVFDQAPFIEQSIEDLTTEGLLGLGFAVVVILLFLLSWRSTLVTALSIPLSVVVVFLGLRVGGYSLNILTLGALTVAIGRVVDDSIVVIENVNRHLSYGEAKLTAILTAVREVAGAVTASTLTTVAVFIPIAVVGGQVGELFRPFAVTVAIALLASLVVSLTIVPVIASALLRGPRTEVDAEEVRRAAEEHERRSLLQRIYVPVLVWVLRRPVLTLLAAVLVLAGTGGLATRLQTNFLGDSGQNSFTVTQTLAAGSSLQTQDEAAQRVEQVLAGIDGVETVQTTVGTSGEGFAALGGSSGSASFAVTTDADADQPAVQDAARAALDGVDGEVSVSGGQSGFGGSSVDVVVTAPDDDTLRAATDLVLPAVQGVAGASDVTSNLAAGQPVVTVTVDREAAAAVGLSEAAVGGLLAGTLTPATVGQLTTAQTGAQDVVLQVGDGPADLEALQTLQIPTATGIVALSSIAEVAEVETATTITRADGEQTATVSATPADADLGSFTTSVQSALDGLDLPEGAQTSLGGVSSDQSEAFGQLGLAMLVAIGIVYLLMVATFRSLVQPLILLVSIPFAATGAIALLLLTSTPLGVPSLIGLLMLVGIVVTNAIVLIDLVNQYRAAGASPREAVLDGARQRLRPIVMTAAATVFALTPMALGLTGGGGFIAQPLAVVVIGGLVSSTLLTLVLVPVLYLLVARARERFARRRARPAVEEPRHAPAHRAGGSGPLEG